MMSAALTEPLDLRWVRTVVEGYRNVPGLDIEALYHEAAELAKDGRGVNAPSFHELMKATSEA